MGRNRNKKSFANQRDDETSEPLFDSFAKAGLRIDAIQPDGNCLFRSFAAQIYGDEDRHLELRSECCKFMLEEEADFFESFLEDVRLVEYCCRMLVDGTWGTQLEVVALCRKYQVHCVIFRPDGLHYSIECEAFAGEYPRIIMLSHHGDCHFNTVRFIERGRDLASFQELDLLLTELGTAPSPSGVKLSKKQARELELRKRKQLPVSPHLNVSLESRRLDL